MKHIAMNRPSFHLPAEWQSKRVYRVIAAVVVLAAVIAIGWYAGTGGFGEWSLFQE